MNNVAGQDNLCAVHHEEWCVSGGAIRRGPQPPEYGVELLDPMSIRLCQGSHLSGFDAAHDETICPFDLTICLRVVDGTIVELNAHFAHQAFTSSAVKFEPLSVMMLWGTPYRCTTLDIKSITGPDSAVFTGLASIHLVNLSTVTNRYFFLWFPL